MLQKNLSAVVDALLNQMENDGYSQQMLEKNRWILGLFEHYCAEAKIIDVSISSASDFVKGYFGFDMYSPSIPIQSAIRYPLLTLFEFERNGSYAKTHHKPQGVDIPKKYDGIFQRYAAYINGLGLAKSTRLKRLLIFSKYLCHLGSMGILDISTIHKDTVYTFIESLGTYAPKTLKGYKVHIRFFLDWLHKEGHISFSGWEALPVIHDEPKSKLMSYYSKDEIARMLSSIDVSDRVGRFSYCAVCFSAYLGMRAGDIIRLKFSDIDWNKNLIHFKQHKTGAPLTLPLLDEVRYPLIDYIRNARYESSDTEHIFITMRAPHRAYANGSILFNIVKRCIETSGIDVDGRHRGPHALRHSLATNLMSGDVPVSDISDILGHTSTLTTEIYLTIDEKHLKEVSLEVPNA